MRGSGFWIELGALYRQADETISRWQFSADRAVHTVQYAHETGGIFYNATLSDLSGPVIATWSYDEAEERVTRDRPLDPAVFEQIWSGIETLSVFRETFTEQLDLAVYPLQHHIVTLISKRGREVKREIHLVPAGSTDAEFATWLGMLGRPDQPPTDAEQASAAQWVNNAVEEFVGQVVADVRWKDHRDGLDVLSMLLYGFALKVASHRMFASNDAAYTAVMRVLTEYVELASEQGGVLLDAASRESVSYVGSTYFTHGSSPHWPSIMDHVFAQIARARILAGEAPGTA